MVRRIAFAKRLPIRREILCVAQIAIELHGIRPPFIPDYSSTAEVPSLILRTAFSAVPFVSER